MTIGYSVDGGNDFISYNSGAAEHTNRYTCLMAWMYSTSTTGNKHAGGKQVGVHVTIDVSDITGTWRIDNAYRAVTGPAVSLSQWYHAATWFDHGANQIKLRVYDANAGTTTTYSQAYTPVNWALNSVETATADFVLFAQTTTPAGGFRGIVAGLKCWKPTGTSDQLSEAQIDLERWILWPGYRPDLCTFWAPIGWPSGSSERSYGQGGDQSGTKSGTFNAPASQPPGVMQILPPMVARPQTRLRM